MRSLLATCLSWLLPAQGKRRATKGVQIAHTSEMAPAKGYENDVTPQTAPTRRLIITSSAVTVPHAVAGVGLPLHRSPRPAEYLRGEDVAFIRPYLVASERARGICHQEAAA